MRRLLFAQTLEQADQLSIAAPGILFRTPKEVGDKSWARRVLVVHQDASSVRSHTVCYCRGRYVTLKHTTRA